MNKMIFAAFTNRSDADKAIDNLSDLEINRDRISVISRQGVNKAEGRTDQNQPERIVEGAGVGATEGGIIGGLAGLLAGSLGVIILGPIAALFGLAGIIGTTVSGIVVGLAAGALVGALARIGLPEETAKRYEHVVSANGVILGVGVDDNEEEIRSVLAENNAEDITALEVPEKTKI